MILAAYLADGYCIDFMASCSICNGLTWLVSCVWREFAEADGLTRVSITLFLAEDGCFMAARGRDAEVRMERTWQGTLDCIRQ